MTYQIYSVLVKALHQRRAQVKRAINKHWSELLQKETLEKSTLKYMSYMNIDSVGIGLTHSVWSSFESTLGYYKE